MCVGNVCDSQRVQSVLLCAGNMHWFTKKCLKPLHQTMVVLKTEVMWMKRKACATTAGVGAANERFGSPACSSCVSFRYLRQKTPHKPSRSFNIHILSPDHATPFQLDFFRPPPFPFLSLATSFLLPDIVSLCCSSSSG